MTSAAKRVSKPDCNRPHEDLRPITRVEVCRRQGLSPSTFYKLKAKYGGMEVSEAARLKALEDENAKLKRLLADTMLDNVVLKDLLGKN